jgi:rhodanese-related sulfurtransferase
MEAYVAFEDLLPFIVAIGILVVFHYVRQLMLGPCINVLELSKRIQNQDGDVVLIDVRSEGEHTGRLGHIVGSVNIPINELADEIKAYGVSLSTDPEKLFVTICRTHNRSPRAARMLRDAGLKNVVVLRGGMMAWASKKLPVKITET